jgi:Zn finger protein HypA/HybF involved in hydrogenase expression
MTTLNTPATRTTSRVTRRNARNHGQCPRCHHVGTFAPNAIVCDRCASTRPSITTVTITVTLALVGGER